MLVGLLDSCTGGSFATVAPERLDYVSDSGMAPFYSAMLLHDSPRADIAAQFTVIREFSRDDYERYGDAYHRLDDILNSGIYAYVRTTFMAVSDTMQLDMEEMRTGLIRYGQPDDIVRIGNRMRGVVLSFCSALHMHQDHIFTEVVEKFGDGSRTHNKVRKAFNRLYEKSLDYRLLWHLRNTMVHHALDAVSISATAFTGEGGEHLAVSLPRIDVSVTADLNNRISQAFRRELLAFEEDPLVLEVAVNAMKMVRATNRQVVKILNPDIGAICATVREFDAIFDGREGVRCLTHDKSTNNPPPLKIGHSGWATNVVDFAREDSYLTW